MQNVALITGASNGIGKELSIIHAEKTGDLVIVSRNKEKLNSLKSEIESKFNRKVVVISKDLSKPESAKELYEEIKTKKISINYLINNAGFGGQGFFHEREFAKDLEMINLNIIALTALTRYFLPEFIKNHSGKILNVASTAAFMPGPLQAVYYASKAYVRSFSNALFRELKDTGVSVTTLMPGATETGFEKKAGLEKTTLFSGKLANAKNVADAGYSAMMKGKMEVISGVKLSQKFLLPLLPILPKKMSMDLIFNMQKKIS